VTTQHTQSEHNDANNVNNTDAAVVDQQQTPETSGSETSSEIPGVSSPSLEANNTPSIEQPSNVETSSSDAAARNMDSSVSLEAQAESSSTTPENTQTPTEQNVAPSERVEEGSNEEVVSEEVDAVADPVFIEESAEVVAEVTPAVEPNEEFHPFTSFIEEFRQAQAQAEAQAEAHLNATLQESQAQTLAEFALPESNTPMVDEPVTVQDVLPPVDFGEGSAFVPTSDGATTVNVADVTVQTPAEAVNTEENQRVAAVAETNHEGENTATSETQRPERPVSPLLRPAQRRFQRHGTTRHREEPVSQPTTMNEATMGTQEASATPAPEQPNETAKPPRRYRFDRRSAAQTSPASKTGQAAPTQVTSAPSNNGAVLTPPPATQPTPTFAHAEESKVTASEPRSSTTSVPTTSTVETPTPEPQNVGVVSTESNNVTAPIEHGRRRQSGDRHREKEQTVTPPITAPASVSDIATALVEESKATPEDVAPEDMPPLEYAELQKANSRRRRRHRTNGNGTTAPKEIAAANGVQPETQVVPPTQAATPPTPMHPAANTEETAATNPYTIVSGYTVGQMNQGNEAHGPFMGPEPSPARGSVNTTRDGRTVRVESQPLRTSYPTTTGTGVGAQGIAPSSMNHFANMVSQAIQTQTDRMVTELRRANQAPTNVSVSLPPFPSTERVGVFVDVANLLYSARTQRIAIDFGKLLDFLRGNRRLVRAHAYCPTSPQPGDEQMFLTAVKGLGYRITTKNYKTFASGAKKADLDLDLCMDVVRLVDGGAVDCIVLVSGDSDFMPMLDYCSDHGVRVEVAAFDEAMSATLRQSCDLFVNLSMLEEIRA